jgi:ABC-type uncharacterized transport system ATPase subunit
MSLLGRVDGTIELSGPQGNYAYIPEQPVLYERLTLWEHLELAAAAHKLSMEESGQTADHLVSRFYLQHAIHHSPMSFSKGMQQKVLLIAGFMAKPDLYIFSCSDGRTLNEERPEIGRSSATCCPLSCSCCSSPSSPVNWRRRV